MSQNSKTSNWAAITALICGIGAFIFNPMYLVCLAAIIFGIVGIATSRSRGMAVAGLILGIVAMVYQFTVDLIITICSLGMGFFSFFI